MKDVKNLKVRDEKLEGAKIVIYIVIYMLVLYATAGILINLMDKL